MSHTAYIALGSNLGDREKAIRSALLELEKVELEFQLKVLAVSSLLENPAVGGPEHSPPFLNAAAQIQTSLEPQALLQQLLSVEQKLGRHRKEKWGPRTIDLDLLLYEDRIIKSKELVLPHPLMHLRSFVLQPLVEIASDLIHPVFQKSIRQLWEELKSSPD